MADSSERSVSATPASRLCSSRLSLQTTQAGRIQHTRRCGHASHETRRPASSLPFSRSSGNDAPVWVEKGELLRRRSTLRLDLEILYREAQLLTTLWTVAAQTLYCLTRRLQLYSTIERFATLSTDDPLRRQKPAKTSLKLNSRIRY